MSPETPQRCPSCGSGDPKVCFGDSKENPPRPHKHGKHGKSCCPDPWHTAPVPAPEPPRCQECGLPGDDRFHGVSNHVFRPAAAPTGTGTCNNFYVECPNGKTVVMRGDEPAYQEILFLRREPGALRSQLEDAQRELGRMFVEKEGWKLQVGKAERDLATAHARIARLTEVLRELDPVNVQPPYDHDGECSYCGVKEGYKHPKDCSWRKAEQALAEPQSGEK